MTVWYKQYLPELSDGSFLDNQASFIRFIYSSSVDFPKDHLGLRGLDLTDIYHIGIHLNSDSIDLRCVKTVSKKKYVESLKQLICKKFNAHHLQTFRKRSTFKYDRNDVITFRYKIDGPTQLAILMECFS